MYIRFYEREKDSLSYIDGSHNQAKLIFEHILAFLGISEADKRYRLSNSINYSRLLDRVRNIKLTCRGAFQTSGYEDALRADLISELMEKIDAGAYDVLK